VARRTGLCPLRQRARAGLRGAEGLVPLRACHHFVHRARGSLAECLRGVLQWALATRALEMESFDTLFEAKVLIDDWRLEYNHYRPHMSLGYLTPAEFARTWRAEHQHDPELS